jgi:hypothetical protein
MLVSSRKWNMALLALALTIISGAVLAFALLLGAANPPYGKQVTEVPPDSLTRAASEFFVASRPQSEPEPITFEVEASVSGQPERGWGIWVHTGSELLDFRVRTDGYFSVRGFHWQQFSHIQSGTNKLYLHIVRNSPFDFQATFRVNDEIAWRGFIGGYEMWGVIQPTDAQPTWKSIKIYTG